MVGIGGCGMSGLARMLAARGAEVTGSDSTSSEVTDALDADGIPVRFDQSAGLVPDRCDLVIASAAIGANHPELACARRRTIPILTYAQALGRCMEGRTGVAIAGTHGKSTTTAMLGVILARCGLDPSVIVGATCGQLSAGGRAPVGHAGFRLGSDVIPSGALAGRPGLLIAEACEYNRSFHNLRPMIAAIGAIEADHLDVYDSIDALVEAFAGFARLIRPADEGGTLLIAHDGAHRRQVCAGLECRVETIGFSPAADWVVRFDPVGRRVRLERDGALVAAWINPMLGEHNAINAATAVALACLLGAEPPGAAAAIEGFGGVDRRMQLLGERYLGDGPGTQPVRVYDDYGHHPTEIEATLRALRDAEQPEQRGGRLICVFQPHQHSRTRHLLEEFANSFSLADIVIVPHIYFVRDSEAERHRVCAGDLVDRLRQRGATAMHVYPFEAIVEQLEILCRPGDLLVVMGAGPVWQVARSFLARGSHAQAGSGVLS